ncbi:MAG: NAD(P)/FAD-dependent oxidoreductase, partial [Pseudolabrys sp.]
AQLSRLGIDPVKLGAVAVDRVSIFSGARSVTAALPFRGLSLSRYRLDDALMQRARDRGAVAKRGVSVRSALPGNKGWTLRCDNGETVECRNLILATGKWGLRGIEDERDGSLVGLKMHFRPNADTLRALTGTVELSLFNSTYAGLELVEDGIANLALLLPRAAVAGIGPGWQSLHNHLSSALPALAERLRGAEPLWEKPLAVVCPSGGHLHAEEEPAFRIGDRLAHIPPFTGDGLAIALTSAALAVEHIRQGRSPQAYLAAARRLTATPIRVASLVSRLAASGLGRAALMRTAIAVPGLLRVLARQTRLPVPTSAVPSAGQGTQVRLAMRGPKR